MSADFTKILVKDDRLEVVDNIKYAVVKGGQNVTMAQFQAISASSSQLVFNIQVPSEQTIIDRRVLLQTDLTLTVVSSAVQQTVTGGAYGLTYVAPDSGCGYGVTAGLAPYPLHQLMTVASATINNNTVSVNIRDVLPFLIRALDKGDLNAYNGMTATATDSFLSYTSGIALSSNPLGGGVPDLNTDYCGRGTLALKGYTITQAATTSTEVFTFHISEPLLISPFIYCNPKSNAQGFYGIQNMNFVFNIGEPVRAFRGLQGVNNVNTTVDPPLYALGTSYASPGGKIVQSTVAVSDADATITLPIIRSVALTSFVNTRLLFTFLTPHPSDLMPARNIVPYYELPRYITNGTAPAKVLPTPGGSNNILPYDLTGGFMVPSQTLQLNQIPDKLVLFVRKPSGSQSFGDSDSFLPIRKISINFNNNSGILASAQCEDLYRMSKNNGSNQSWGEFMGLVNSQYIDLQFGANTSTLAVACQSPYVPQWVQATGATDIVISGVAAGGGGLPGVKPPQSSFTSIPTAGSCLMLEFGKDIQLIEDFFAPGSLGNFAIQVQVFVDNYNDSLPTNAPVELVMITMNSGVFVCERGTSSTYTGILTRADVLEASEQDAYTHSDVKRMVGGGFLDMLKSGVSKLAPLMKVVAPLAKDYLGKKGAMGKLASQGISALGGAMSGSGGSGAGMSGGALRGRYM